MSDAHAAMHSDYKSSDTIKYLAGCDPIGCTYDEALPEDGFAGSIDDGIATRKSKILEHVPSFGMVVEVDKGFLIENLCIDLGLGRERPFL